MADINKKKVPAIFYYSTSRNEPVREWLLERTKEDRKSIGSDIQTVEFGCPIGMPVCRPMGGGLYEVRTNLDDKRIARFFFVSVAEKWCCCMDLSRNPKKHLNQTLS